MFFSIDKKKFKINFSKSYKLVGWLIGCDFAVHKCYISHKSQSILVSFHVMVVAVS